MQQIRQAYGVPAKRGGRVEYFGGTKPVLGTITAAKNGRLRIRVDGEKVAGIYHPTCGIIYYPPKGKA